MVPDMMAVYHLQKNKGTGVCAMIWNNQIPPVQPPPPPHTPPHPETLLPVQVEAAAAV